MQCFAIVRPIIIRPSLFGRIYPRCHIHRLRPLDLDVRQELVDYLVSKEFSESQAKGLIDTLDASILEALTNRSRNLITTQEYLTLRQSFQDALEECRKDLYQANLLNQNTFLSDHDKLLAQITRTRSTLTEEATRMQSSVQLDLNLEGKRREEGRAETEGKMTEAGRLVEDKGNEIHKRLKAVGNVTFRIAFGVPTMILVGFILSKLSI